MRQDDRVDAEAGSIGNGSQFLQPQLLQPLKQAAIDEDPPAVDLEQVLGAGHRPGRAQERQVHAFVT